VINNTCGIKIPVTNPKETKKGFAIAIEKLYHDEALRYQLAEGALQRSKDFSWDKKITQLNLIYQEVVNQ
jgi:glycosyltransferase involved in cell wall biosynthesis